MERTALKIKGIPYYSGPEVKTVLEKLSCQLSTGNNEPLRVLISHYIEKLDTGDALCG